MEGASPWMDWDWFGFDDARARLEARRVDDEDDDANRATIVVVVVVSSSRARRVGRRSR